MVQNSILAFIKLSPQMLVQKATPVLRYCPNLDLYITLKSMFIIPNRDNPTQLQECKRNIQLREVLNKVPYPSPLNATITEYHNTGVSYHHLN